MASHPATEWSQLHHNEAPTGLRSILALPEIHPGSDGNAALAEIGVRYISHKDSGTLQVAEKQPIDHNHVLWGFSACIVQLSDGFWVSDSESFPPFVSILLSFARQHREQALA